MAVTSSKPTSQNLTGNSVISSRQQERNKKKKLRKKAARQRKREQTQQPQLENGFDNNLQPGSSGSASGSDSEDDLPQFELKGPFERFKLASEEVDAAPVKPASHTDINLKARTAALLAAEEASANESRQQRRAGFNENVDAHRPTVTSNRIKGANADLNRPSDGDTDGAKPVEVLSKKKLKRLNRPSVASLKQAVSRPDVVEMWDVCARDPMLLIFLKSHRNTVPVPRHWCAKRKYLQGKRGFEKPPFRLPDFIARTGIMEMRQTVQDKDSDKTLKTKMREKIRPKVGKVDIDYHKLHDAFFKYQTKPKMSIHGDLYYEGKEFEVKLKEKKPGNLSDELRSALGLPSGTGAEKYPPPWLIAMQRYGPPPSYPNLKIPGLNAPIPDGCAFGYHPGGWGKPPVDELGRPVYGDVFGNGGNVAGVPPPPPAPIDEADEEIAHGHITYWGELESDEESEGEDEEQADESDESDAELPPVANADVVQTIVPAGAVMRKPTDIDLGGIVTPAGGLITPSGVSSVGAGLETPQSTIELRKKTIEEAMEDSSGLVTPSSQLYRILPERDTNLQPGALMGSTKLYDLAGVTGAPRGMEAENPRDSMLRKRPSGTDSQSGQQSSGLKSGGTSAATSTGGAASNQPLLPPATKKYKEFKF